MMDVSSEVETEACPLASMAVEDPTRVEVTSASSSAVEEDCRCNLVRRERPEVLRDAGLEGRMFRALAYERSASANSDRDREATRRSPRIRSVPKAVMTPGKPSIRAAYNHYKMVIHTKTKSQVVRVLNSRIAH